jgi:hypothetical protein
MIWARVFCVLAVVAALAWVAFELADAAGRVGGFS